jgi:hypothetical protein
MFNCFGAHFLFGLVNFLTHQVRVSYIEIYLEKIKDLLNPAQDNLNVREGGTGPAGMS